MARSAKFFRFSGSERWFLIQAAGLVCLARLAVLMLPFRWLTGFLRQQQGVKPETGEPGPVAQKVALALGRVWAGGWQNCLALALAGKVMLRQRGVASTLYLGVLKNNAGGFEAHAWLRSGSFIVTGGSGLQRYTVVATFSDKE